MIDPIFDEIAQEFKSVNVVKIDVDSNPHTSVKYGARTMPTILFFEQGNIVDKQVGFAPKSTFLSKLEPLIKNYDEELAKEVEFIGITLINEEVKLVSFTKDGKYKFLDENCNSHLISYGLSFESRAMKEAIEELEHLINDPKVKEFDLQNFFERNPDFIIEDKYKVAHSKVVLENEDSEKYIPDFILEPIESNSLCDMLDLKLPSANIFVMKKNRPRYSAAILEAAAQLREYATILETKANRQKVFDKYGLNLYKPKMIVVIGRRGAYDPIIIRRIESDIPNLELKTYDSILDRIKFRFR